MGEKDITEKELFELDDVFADIVNVLLFNGKEEILPEDLKTVKRDSTFKDKELKIRMQERDVAKIWEQGGVRIAFFGLEDQTSVDYTMPIRIASYDGATYREMLRMQEERKKENKSSLPIYPVITLVLHFDYEKHWTAPRTLKDCFKNISKILEPYVSDYKINVFEIAWLDDETVKKFKSDFKYVVDYYVQMRKTGKWKPMPEKVKHIKELFDLLGTLTRDKRFIEMYQKMKGEVRDMSSVALDYLAEEYRAEGEDIAIVKSIRNLMKSLNFNVQQAMDALLVPKEERQKYMDKI